MKKIAKVLLTFSLVLTIGQSVAIPVSAHQEQEYINNDIGSYYKEVKRFSVTSNYPAKIVHQERIRNRIYKGTLWFKHRKKVKGGYKVTYSGKMYLLDNPRLLRTPKVKQ